MYTDLTPRELVRRSVAMARMRRRLARRCNPEARVEQLSLADHAMLLARHLKQAATRAKTYE